MRVAVLLNGDGGRLSRESGLVEQTRAAFADAGVEATVETLSAGKLIARAEALIAAGGIDALVVGGGDGTQGAVAALLCALAFLLLSLLPLRHWLARLVAAVVAAAIVCGLLLWLDPAILKAGAGAGYSPALILANRPGVFAKLRIAAVADLVAATLPVGETFVTGAREAAVQCVEKLDRLGGEAVDLLPDLRGGAHGEAIGDERDVVAAVAQRGDLDGDDAEAVIEVLSEVARRRVGREVTVGGGDDPHVHPDR